MEIQDLKLNSEKDVQQLTKIFKRLPKDINLNYILQTIKLQLKNIGDICIEKLINFFMFLYSKYNPKNDKQWSDSFHMEIKIIQKNLRSQKFYGKNLMRRAFISLFKKKTLLKIKKEDNGIVRTEVSNNLNNTYAGINFYSFRSEANININTLFQFEPEKIETDTKLKSIAFYSWLKYIENRQNFKQKKEKQIVDLRKSKQLYQLNLKMKSVFQWKKYLSVLKIQKNKIQEIKSKVSFNLKNTLFKVMLDSYLIVQIEEAILKKVINLRNQQFKVRGIQKLSLNKAQSKVFFGYNNYFAYLFVKAMVEKGLGKVLSDNEQELKRQIKGSKSNQQSISHQLVMINKIIKEKTFNSLKNYLNTMKIQRLEQRQRQKQIIFEAFRNQIIKQKALKMKIYEMGKIRLKYHLLYFLNKNALRYEQKEWMNDQTNKVSNKLKKIFLKNFKIQLKLQNQNINQQQSHIKIIKNFTNKVQKINVFRKFQERKNMKLLLGKNLQKLENLIEFNQMKKLFNQLIKNKKRLILQRQQVIRVQNFFVRNISKRYFKKMFLYKNYIQKKNMKIETAYLKYQKTLKSKSINSWLNFLRSKRQTNLKIEKFNKKLLLKYFNSLKLTLQTKLIKLQTFKIKKISGLLKKSFNNLINYRLKEKELILKLKDILRIRSCQTFYSRLDSILNLKMNFSTIRTIRKQKYIKKFVNCVIERSQSENEKIIREQIVIKKIPFTFFKNNIINIKRKKIQINNKNNRLLQNILKNSWEKFSQITRLSIQRTQITQQLRQRLKKRNVKIFYSKFINFIKNKSKKQQIKQKQDQYKTYKITNSVIQSLELLKRASLIKKNEIKLFKLIKCKGVKQIKKIMKNLHFKKQNISKKISPFINKIQKNKLRSIIINLRNIVINKKKAVAKIESSFKNIKKQIYQDAIKQIFDEFSFKCRTQTACFYYKRLVFRKFTKNNIENLSQKQKTFNAYKLYAKKLLKNGFNSLVLNNTTQCNNQQNNVNISSINLQKWKNTYRKMTEPNQRKIQKYFKRSLIR